MATSTVPRDPTAALADLERRLRETPRASRPLEHAALRYSLGLAYAELPSGDRIANLDRAVRSYRQAAEIFAPDRMPVEHARVQTALGAALRELGRDGEAIEALERAAALLEAAGATGELGAALNNLGLARSAGGDHAGATDALARAVTAFSAGGLERQRLTALHNLGQAHAAATDHATAVETYREALREADPEKADYIWGMLQHSLGVSLTALGDARAAAVAFRDALRVFTRQRFPFQWALAKNNLGLAYAQAGDVDALRRAVSAYEDALQLLDPRMHREPWEQTYRNLNLTEAALREHGVAESRTESFVNACANAEGSEREALFRERLMHVLGLPEPRRSEVLTDLAEAINGLRDDASVALMATWLHMLMELPHEMLLAALQAWLAVWGGLDEAGQERADEIMERTIMNELLAPQRIRVRDTLYALGHERR